MTRAAALGLLLAGALAGPAAARAIAQDLALGGDVRGYAFGRLEDGPGRADAELAVLRLRLGYAPGPDVALEAHAVLALASPGEAGRVEPAFSLVRAQGRRLLRLQTELTEDDVAGQAGLDRLLLAWDRPGLRLGVGRQAITWGVLYFWPALDLFAPFRPEQFDRDYKPGVDALRATVPLGALSELEVVAAAQGTSLREDGSVGVLGRFHLGALDAGPMAGWFHEDVVLGAFVTADVRGTGLRGEAAFTRAGRAEDAALGRRTFWRAGVGVDRQLTATVAVTAEAAFNGFGSESPARYPAVAAADRVQRGEITALGRYYLGLSATWQVHPLVSLVGGGLANLGDGSLLLLPRLEWSVSDAATLELGALVGLGAGPGPSGLPRSEFGAVPATLYAGLRLYF